MGNYRVRSAHVPTIVLTFGTVSFLSEALIMMKMRVKKMEATRSVSKTCCTLLALTEEKGRRTGMTSNVFFFEEEKKSVFLCGSFTHSYVLLRESLSCSATSVFFSIPPFPSSRTRNGILF